MTKRWQTKQIDDCMAVVDYDEARREAVRQARKTGTPHVLIPDTMGTVTAYIVCPVAFAALPDAPRCDTHLCRNPRDGNGHCIECALEMSKEAG